MTLIDMWDEKMWGKEIKLIFADHSIAAITLPKNPVMGRRQYEEEGMDMIMGVMDFIRPPKDGWKVLNLLRSSATHFFTPTKFTVGTVLMVVGERNKWRIEMPHISRIIIEGKELVFDGPRILSMNSE